MPRTSSKHVDVQHDWVWCCEHAASDDFQEALRLLQPLLPMKPLRTRCCSLRPAEMHLRFNCATNGPSDEAIAVRVWLGASGASLFRLQVHSLTGRAISPGCVDNPTFELNTMTGATIRLHGMANYGVASYCAALGQALDAQHQLLQLQPAAPKQKQQKQKQLLQTVPGSRSGGIPARRRGHYHNDSSSSSSIAPVLPFQGGPAVISKAPDAAVSSSVPEERVANSVSPAVVAARRAGSSNSRNLPSRAAAGTCRSSLVGSGGGERAENVETAARCHINNWLAVLLSTADIMDGGSASAAGTAAGAGAGAGAGACTWYDDDDLHPDVVGTLNVSCSSKIFSSRPAAVRVTAWLRTSQESAAAAAAEDGSMGKAGVAAAAAAAAVVVPVPVLAIWQTKEGNEVGEGGTAAAAAAAGVFIAAADDGGSCGGGGGDDSDVNDMANDADAARQALYNGLHWVPAGGGATRRNAHLLELLGLPQAVRSFRMPVSELDSEPAAPYRPTGQCEERVSVLGLLDDAVEADVPYWACWGPPAYGFGCDGFLSASPRVAEMTTGAGSYSLVDSAPAPAAASAPPSSSVLAAPAAAACGMSQQLVAAQQQELQMPPLRPAVPLVAVEVLNLLGSAAAPRNGAARNTGDYALSSCIDSLDWPADLPDSDMEELGGEGSLSQGQLSADMFASMFEGPDLKMCGRHGAVPYTVDGSGGGDGRQRWFCRGRDADRPLLSLTGPMWL